MSTSAALFGVLAGITGFLGVAAGAFGAHALGAQLPSSLLQVFETGARYQLTHALALGIVAVAHDRMQRRALTVAGWFFVVGQILFPGSLYALALTSVPAWGAVTPIGGVCYVAGWLSLALAFVQRKTG